MSILNEPSTDDLSSPPNTWLLTITLSRFTNRKLAPGVCPATGVQYKVSRSDSLVTEIFKVLYELVVHVDNLLKVLLREILVEVIIGAITEIDGRCQIIIGIIVFL